MIDPTHIPPVASDELVARFILFSRHIRGSDNTVRPEAFMPHPLVALSITRHLDTSEEELWLEGRRVAGLRAATLHGRADVAAGAFQAEGLSVVARPIPENTNHADVTNWPADKPQQKIKALVIASKSRYLPHGQDTTGRW